MLVVHQLHTHLRHFVTEQGTVLCNQTIPTQASERVFGQLVTCKVCWESFGRWSIQHPEDARVTLERMVDKGICACGKEAWCWTLEHTAGECDGTC